MARNVSRESVARYARLLHLIDEKARGAVVGALSRIDIESAPYGEYRDSVLSVLDRTDGFASTTAARVSADFYDNVRAEVLGNGQPYEAVISRDVPPDANAKAVQGIIGEHGRNRAAVTQAVADRVSTNLHRTANETIRKNSARDRKSKRYARVPAGSETCDWCIMLASRGFVYHTQDTASHSHPNCDCVCVPSFGGSGVEDYDQDYYRDCYKHPERHPEIREAQNARRRELYAEKTRDERARLEDEARAVYVGHAADMGLTEDEAAERFGLLVDGNTDAQLRRYIDTH